MLLSKRYSITPWKIEDTGIIYKTIRGFARSVARCRARAYQGIVKNQRILGRNFFSDNITEIASFHLSRN